MNPKAQTALAARTAKENAAYEARQGLRKAACEFAAAVLLGNPEVTAAAFTRLDAASDANTKAKS